MITRANVMAVVVMCVCAVDGVARVGRVDGVDGARLKSHPGVARAPRRRATVEQTGRDRAPTRGS